MTSKFKYKRILLKLSGEVLGGQTESGIDFKFINKLVAEIKSLSKKGLEMAIVIGGGNFWRYRDFKDSNLERVHSDYLGMLATIINSVALQDELRAQKVKAVALSAVSVRKLLEDYSWRKAIDLLDNGEIVICAGGTGNPFCSTDTAAVLRAGELACDLIVKATNVDYVYDKDPHKFKNAKPYKTVSYDEVLTNSLGIMDLGAVAMAKDAQVPIAIFNLNKPQNLLEIVQGKNVGTIIS